MIFVILALQGKTGKINILSKGLYTGVCMRSISRSCFFVRNESMCYTGKLTMDINKIGWRRTVKIYPPL